MGQLIATHKERFALVPVEALQQLTGKAAESYQRIADQWHRDSDFAAVIHGLDDQHIVKVGNDGTLYWYYNLSDLLTQGL